MSKFNDLYEIQLNEGTLSLKSYESEYSDYEHGNVVGAVKRLQELLKHIDEELNKAASEAGGFVSSGLLKTFEKEVQPILKKKRKV